MAGYAKAFLGPRTWAQARSPIITNYAFAFSGSTGGATQDQTDVRTDLGSYGTLGSYAFDVLTSINGIVGQNHIFSGTDKWTRSRTLLDIPAAFSSISQLQLSINLKTAPAINFTIGWYASNTNDYSGSAASRWGNTNVLLGSIATAGMVVGTNYLINSSSLAEYLAQIGGNFSMILASTNDVASVDDVPVVNNKAFSQIGDTSSDPLKLQINVTH